MNFMCNFYSEEIIEIAKKVCQCCPDCNDWPCEGSLNWDNHCEDNSCHCDEGIDE